MKKFLALLMCFLLVFALAACGDGGKNDGNTGDDPSITDPDDPSDPDDPECRRLMKIIDGIIFSPVPRRLSSAFIVRTREEAAALMDGVKDAFPSVITFRVSEGKEKP